MATTAKAASARTLRRARAAVPLARALSKLGLASRSEAHTLIRAGRVTVNGLTVTDPATTVTPERVRIAIDGATAAPAAPVTIILNKPRGYLTTRSDPEGRKTVYDLLHDLPERVNPVGRLDLATSGLLLLTNDTQFGNWLTDPQSAVPRTYLVTVKGRVTDDTAQRLTLGMTVDGEPLVATEVEIRKASRRESHLTVTLTEGKNREIRRLLKAVGHEVTRLRRVQFGGIGLGALSPGAWRRLDPAEVARAFPAYGRRKRSPSPK